MSESSIAHIDQVLGIDHHAHTEAVISSLESVRISILLSSMFSTDITHFMVASAINDEIERLREHTYEQDFITHINI